MYFFIYNVSIIFLSNLSFLEVIFCIKVDYYLNSPIATTLANKTLANTLVDEVSILYEEDGNETEHLMNMPI